MQAGLLSRTRTEGVLPPRKGTGVRHVASGKGLRAGAADEAAAALLTEARRTVIALKTEVQVRN